MPKKNNAAKLAALEALELLETIPDPTATSDTTSPNSPISLPFDDDDDSKLSAKEMRAAMKAKNKKKQGPETPASDSAEDDLEVILAPKKKNKKNKNKKKGDEGKSDEKEDSEPALEVAAPPPPSAAADPLSASFQTLEDKLRNSRPPPKVRIMEGVQPGFVSLSLSGVSQVYRNQEVLKDVNWSVSTGDRVGLVGANGGGKTTQLRIMGGEMEPTSGDVVKSSASLRVSVLRQEFVDELVLTRSLKDEFLSVFVEENGIIDKLREVEKELESLGDGDASEMQKILDEMQALQGKADAKGVYGLESRAEKAMHLMGFDSQDASAPVSSFSGGWKMRIGLGKVLLTDPNVLLLDEPTNHLDLESVEWLEDFLRNQKIPLVIVSHDREFLDQVCTKIVDTEGGMSTSYETNFSGFLQQKEARMKAWQSKWDAQEKKIQSERAWIQKFKAKQPDAVKQRQTKLDKLIASEDGVQKPPFVGKPFRFRFPPAPRLSDEIAVLDSVTHGYANDLLFDNARMVVEKGDRIAVLGPNGCGKSTLLRLMMGREKCNEGSAKLVGMNVVANYFEQNQADVLDLDRTVRQTVEDNSNGHSNNELRALLGQFLFKGDAVDKKVGSLSGGEKARLSLCIMMLTPANVLVLDEPTNHLDIPAKEMLEEALQNFDGSLVVVSHDRFFISRIATTIAAVEEKKIVIYPGDYKLYMEKNAEVQDKVEGRYVKGVRPIGKAVVVVKEEKKSFGGKAAGVGANPNKGVKNAKRNGVNK